jgi:hypothetical protein
VENVEDSKSNAMMDVQAMEAAVEQFYQAIRVAHRTNLAGSLRNIEGTSR